jgi:hypothetical protein
MKIICKIKFEMMSIRGVSYLKEALEFDRRVTFIGSYLEYRHRTL